MTTDGISRPAEPSTALPQALVDYRAGHFDLGEEIACLINVQRSGAVAAEIFYAARILEVLAAEAVRLINLVPTTNMFANLDTLLQLNVLPRATGYSAHALRRTGNVVRHVHRRVGLDDAELSVLFLERWLCWFFRDYSLGPRRQDLRLESLQLRGSADVNLRSLLHLLETDSFTFDILSGHPAVLRSPTLPAVAAEVLIGRGEVTTGRELILKALEQFPEDMRLRQLMGLSFSRQGELAKAREWLEPLLERHRDDEETIGMTAGLFKRLADASPGQTDYLVRAHNAYLHGWQRSQKSNAYLGINAAFTALLLGQLSLAALLAAGVRDLLLKRLSVLGGEPASASLTLGYWDSASLAEANLILDDLPASRATYREAFTRHAAMPGNLDVTRQQLQRLLAIKGMPTDIEAFLAVSSPLAASRSQ